MRAELMRVVPPLLSSGSIPSWTTGAADISWPS